MKVLHERISSTLVRDKQFEDFSRKKSFTLSDSMSAVEIDCIVTKSIYTELIGGETGAALASLQRAAGDRALFPKVDEARTRLSQSCHSLIFNVCYAVPRRHLSSLPSMVVWKEENVADELASYGTLPQQYITHVGEHILALVQALEPFASDPSALSLANDAMSNIRDVALPFWRELMHACGGADTSDGVVRALMEGKDISSRVVRRTSLEEEERDLEEEDEQSRATAAFCNAWLDVVGLAVTGRLLERIVRIPSLTSKGCEHLKSDLSYLINVFSALGVTGHPHLLLYHFIDLIALDGSALAVRITTYDGKTPTENALVALEERIAAIRGVSAGYNY
jgi:hypothetical protein